MPSISPTDVSQFIRLDQCERYLRLRLHERSAGSRFMRDYEAAPQPIPPLLTRSGTTFEERVERSVAERFRSLNLAKDAENAAGRPADNGRVVAFARNLPPARRWSCFNQGSMSPSEGWKIRGDVDLLVLERDGNGGLRTLIADIKSSTSAKVEHRLQVTFYLGDAVGPAGGGWSPATASTSGSSTADRPTTRDRSLPPTWPGAGGVGQGSRPVGRR